VVAEGRPKFPHYDAAVSRPTFPDIDPAKPREAATVCGDSDIRYQRYSCTHGFGHAFMRLNEGQLDAALALCTALGSGAAPDCAQSPR
jgi:hypothetical protein